MHVTLDRFIARPYQLPLIRAFTERKVLKFIALWPRRCLAGDTHITMADGSWKFLKDIVPGDKILSWNGNAFVADTVKHAWKTGVKETKVVKGTGYLPITTSIDHRFAVGYKTLTYLPLDELKGNTKLLNYVGMDCGNLHNPDMAEFIGYMLCDGYVVGHQQPKFTNVNIAILKRVEYLVKKLFGYDSIWRKKGNAYDLGFSNGTKGGGTFKNTIKELFRGYGLDVPKSKKRLFPFVWNFDRESLGRFFAAVISSDGSIYAHNNSRTVLRNGEERLIPPANDITIHCGLSYELGWDMYWLLRKIGIVSHTPIKEKESNWRIRITKSSAINELLSYGPIYGKEDKQEFMLRRMSDTPRKRYIYHGCYRSSYKLEDGEPQELYDIETKKHHNFIANGYLVHNSGKDICAWNLMIREALRVKGNYWYVWPSFAQARRGLWETITNTGETFFDYIPKQLIVSKHDSLMRLTLVNGSIMRLVGSDDVDSLRGTNCKGIIFSEASIQKSGCYMVLQPIVAANPGAWMLFVTTPFGKNHFFDLYQGALKSEDWWVQKLTLDDTKHVSLELLEKELAEGSLTKESIQAEYYCSFERGVEGSVYGTNMNIAKREGRIGHVPYNRAYPVHTAIDIGFTDHSAVIFFQVIDDSIKIIDAFQKNKEPLEYYVKQIKSKEYNYGRHFAPHDLRNSSFSTGLTRLNHASQLGIDFEIVPSLTIMDGIDHGRRIFNRVWIDKDKCKELIDALENYRFKWDPDTQIYGKPFHNQYSHMADSFRMLAISIQNIRDYSTIPNADDLNAIEQRVRYNRSTFADPFTKK